MANKNGKKGSEKHQEAQKAEFHKTEKEYEGNKEIIVKTEVTVQTPNGVKDIRVADVGAFSWLKNTFRMKFHKIIQIGRTNKDGTPVKREQEAIEDIEQHTGIQVTFVDYENSKLEDDDRKMR